MPRRGSRFTSSTSCSIVCPPSPTTWPGTRLETATSRPLITSIRWSSPEMKLSMMTLRLCSRATANALRTSSAVVMWMVIPRPWLALNGFTTTG